MQVTALGVLRFSGWDQHSSGTCKLPKPLHSLSSTGTEETQKHSSAEQTLQTVTALHQINNSSRFPRSLTVSGYFAMKHFHVLG